MKKYTAQLDVEVFVEKEQTPQAGVSADHPNTPGTILQPSGPLLHKAPILRKVPILSGRNLKDKNSN